ncbi:MAG: DUF1648 domain-containing protein [Polyangiales bacterium]
MSVTARRVVLVVSAVILAVLPLGLGLYWAPDLPEPMASRWDLAGAPLGRTSQLTFLAIMSALALPGALLVAWAGLARSARRWVRVALAGFGAFNAMPLGALSIVATSMQRGVASWRDGHGPSWVVLVAIMIGSAVLAALLAALANGWPEDARHTQSRAPIAASVGLGADEHAVWSRRISNRWLYLFAAPLFVMAAGLGRTEPLAAAATAALGLLCVETATCLVTVDRRGLSMRWGTSGLWRHVIPLGDILRAGSIHVQPIVWGGWGYRGSLFIMKRAAMVMRGGPGVHLELTGGREFALTVNDPETAAGLINDLVARRAE